MTVRQNRRRRPEAAPLDADLAAWFAGRTRSAPWAALLPAELRELPAAWRAWVDEHPDAVPPDAPWLDWAAMEAAL